MHLDYSVWAIVWCSPTNDYISIISQATSLSWSVNQAKVCPIFDTKLDGKLTQKFLLIPTAPLEKFHSDNSDADVLIIHKLIRKVMRCLKQQWAYIHLPLNRQPSRQRRKNFSWSELYAPLGKKMDSFTAQTAMTRRAKPSGWAESKAKTGQMDIVPRSSIQTYKQYFSACMNTQKKKQNQNFSFHFYSNTTEFTQKEPRYRSDEICRNAW